MKAQPKPTRIIELSAENFKRIRAIDIRPDSDLVTIRGRNAQGKSSVLDAIEAAIGGKRRAPSKPVRNGQKKAKIVAKLDGLTIRRTFTADGGGTLVVEADDGSRLSSPQSVLDRLVGSLSFDPLDFLRLVRKRPREAIDAVRDVAGVDVGPLDGERARLFEERSDVNRDCKRLAVVVGAHPADPGAPTEPVDVAELLEELKRDEEAHRRAASLRREAELAGSAVATVRREIEVVEERAASLRAMLSTMDAELVGLEERRCELEEEHQKAFAAAEDADDLPDLAPIREKIAGAQSHNDRHRENVDRLDAVADLSAARARAEELTKAIAGVDHRKRDLIAGADLPVEGLAWDDDGVTLGGVPFDQASSAEQLRASVALAIAANPGLRVLLVREGSLLDADGLALLGEMAAEHGAQVWVEVVDDGDGVGIVIEDGEIRGDEDHEGAGAPSEELRP